MENIDYLEIMKSNLLSKNIDTTRMKATSFLMVLTGLDGFAYQREDGVYVVPVGCLRN